MDKMLDPKFAEYLPKLLDDQMEFEHAFKEKIYSVFVIDPNGWFDLQKQDVEDKNIVYVDFALWENEDFTLLAKQFDEFIKGGQYSLDGLLLDNIDCVPADPENAALMENFVGFALKRDDDYIMPGHSEPMQFSKLMIAARCSKYPEYLDDYHIMAHFKEID